jgi:hypothetical protein
MLFKDYGRALKDEAMEYGSDMEDPEGSADMGTLMPEELGMQAPETAPVGMMSPEESMGAFEESMGAEPAEMPAEPEGYDAKQYLMEMISKRQMAREKASMEYQSQQQMLSDKVFGTKHTGGGY